MTLTYNENDREHFGIVQILGHLLGRIDAGVVHRNDQSHSYYKGIELLKLYPGSKGRGQYFLKADCTGAGQTAHGRSRNRVVVKMGQDNRPVAGEGWFWRHDDRVLKLGPNFFQRAAVPRAFMAKLLDKTAA